MNESNKDKIAEKEAKPRFTLIPPHAQLNIVKVLEFGAIKHGAYAWKKYPINAYIDAMERHLNAIRRGEWVDPESGLPHAAHIASSAMFVDEMAQMNPAMIREWRRIHLWEPCDDYEMI
jgi:hypothetical protein